MYVVVLEARLNFLLLKLGREQLKNIVKFYTKFERVFKNIHCKNSLGINSNYLSL